MSVHIPSQREIFRTIRRHGWRIEKHRKHYRCYAPSGEMVTISVSASDRRAVYRILNDLRQRGVSI